MFLKQRPSLYLMLILILFVQVSINFVGALGPELGFDALWYHLTLPKLYIETGKIFYIPGNLLYYSAMPKLIEALYMPAVYFGGEILAKVLHFLLGLGSLIALYKLSKKILPKTESLLVLVVFYSNLVVAWQSTTAYIDLGRTFFEILALYFLVSYYKYKNDVALKKSAVSLGFAISSKLLSLGSLIVYIFILILNKERLSTVIKFIFLVFIVSSPWFVFSFVNTGNPVFPFFEKIYKIAPSINIFNIIYLIYSADPISPLYLISLPLFILIWKKLDKIEWIIAIYSILSFFMWYVTPQTGGGRYIMPYLPAYSLMAIIAIFKIKHRLVYSYMIGVVLFIALTTIVYRGVANSKYLPVIFGVQSKHEFLSERLNFNFGDFYDTDNYFRDNIKPSDNVLIYGTHNLYYVDFPFIHESWRNSSDKFNYVMTQNVNLPKEFYRWKQIYSNKKTNVKLYSEK